MTQTFTLLSLLCSLYLNGTCAVMNKATPYNAPFIHGSDALSVAKLRSLHQDKIANALMNKSNDATMNCHRHLCTAPLHNAKLQNTSQRTNKRLFAFCLLTKQKASIIPEAHPRHIKNKPTIIPPLYRERGANVSKNINLSQKTHFLWRGIT